MFTISGNSARRIRVRGIEALYQELHAKGLLEPPAAVTQKPWGHTSLRSLAQNGSSSPLWSKETKAKHKTLADSFPTAVRAVKTGDVETLTQLLADHPALANARSQQGRTLLHHLCDWPGHCPREEETGRALFAAGADVNARAIDPAKGETALPWAASRDDAALAEFLIDAGEPVDGLDDDRRPLAQALWYGCQQVAEVLVRRGATPDLELAAGMGRTDLLPTFFDADGNLLPTAGRHHPPGECTSLSRKAIH